VLICSEVTRETRSFHPIRCTESVRLTSVNDYGVSIPQQTEDQPDCLLPAQERVSRRGSNRSCQHTPSCFQNAQDGTRRGAARRRRSREAMFDGGVRLRKQCRNDFRTTATSDTIRRVSFTRDSHNGMSRWLTTTDITIRACAGRTVRSRKAARIKSRGGALSTGQSLAC